MQYPDPGGAKVPRGHNLPRAVPAGHANPPRHCPVQRLDERLDVNPYVPLGHSEHSGALALLNLPAGQVVGALAFRGQADPAGQGRQGTNRRPPGEYCPGGHKIWEQRKYMHEAHPMTEPPSP